MTWPSWRKVLRRKTPEWRNWSCALGTATSTHGLPTASVRHRNEFAPPVAATRAVNRRGGRRLQQTVGASPARQGSWTSRPAMPETASTMPTSSARSARLNVNVDVTFT